MLREEEGEEASLAQPAARCSTSNLSIQATIAILVYGEDSLNLFLSHLKIRVSLSQKKLLFWCFKRQK